MSKTATILGLAAAASAAVAPAYGASSAPAYGASSAPAYGASSSVTWSAAPSSSAPAYGGSSSSGAWGVSSSSVSDYPSSASSYVPSSSSAAPTSPPFPSCWSECFQEAGVTSESEVCGDEEIATCIHDKCDCADTSSYFSWYNSYCQAPSSSSSVGVYPTSSSVGVYPTSSSPVYTSSSIVTSTIPSATPSSPIDSCWATCFSENGVTSEASLCGNDAVSQCIHDTCCAAEDAAYWNWYNGFCVATSTGTTTVTTVCTPLTTPYSAVTTTYVSTVTYGWGPGTSAAATTGLPAPPASAPAPYSAYTPASSAAAVGTAGPTGTGYAAPSASTWAPVPATGAGAATKPGVFFAAAMALAALF